MNHREPPHVASEGVRHLSFDHGKPPGTESLDNYYMLWGICLGSTRAYIGLNLASLPRRTHPTGVQSPVRTA